LHKIYRHKKSISVSCVYDGDGDSNHTIYIRTGITKYSWNVLRKV